MTDLKVTERERQLLLEILEAQQRALQFEGRRTESFGLHHEVRERLRAVDRLIERLSAAESVTS
jgi:hypothetical protein